MKSGVYGSPSPPGSQMVYQVFKLISLFGLKRAAGWNPMNIYGFAQKYYNNGLYRKLDKVQKSFIGAVDTPQTHQALKYALDSVRHAHEQQFGKRISFD